MIHRNLGPLFDQPAKVSAQALRNARQASAEAAEKIAPRIGELHRQILRCLLRVAFVALGVSAALKDQWAAALVAYAVPAAAVTAWVRVCEIERRTP